MTLTTDDYLPRPEGANPTAAPPKSSVRSILLWLALILVFVTIYNVMSTSPPKGSPSSSSSSGLGFLWPLTAALMMGAFVLWVRRQLRGNDTLSLALEPGLLALADGDPGRAVESFRAAVASFEKQPMSCAVARMNLAAALKRVGKFDEAAEALVTAERTPGLLFGSDVRMAAACELASLFALRGELELAEKWIADARSRLRVAQNRTHQAAVLRLCEAIVRCRRQDPAEATRLIDESWTRLEAVFSTSQMKVAWLVRAFLAMRKGDPRDLGAAEPWLSLLRSGRPGELAYVTTAWPEMAAFAETLGLAVARPRTAIAS